MNKHVAEQFSMPLPYEGPGTVGRAYSTHTTDNRSQKLPEIVPQARRGTDDRKHHRYGMSVLNYLAACPGFASRGGTNAAAEDGQRLHDIMEKVAAVLQNPYAETVEELGKPMTAIAALERVLRAEAVSEEETFHLRYCCKELDFWLVKNPIKIVSEARVHIYNPGGSELNFGHFDLLIFLPDETAILFDYKFGWLPVPPASQNWQGEGYAVACFQKYPELKKIGVIFIQPKLHSTTRCSYDRARLFDLYQEVKHVIRAAQAEQKTLRPGPYCDFCGIAGTCKALLNEAQRAVAIHESLPMPQSFVGLQIETPEEAARALYVLDRLEVLIRESGLKEKARQLARENNGQLKCALPDGREIIVDLKQRNAPRSANSPALIADALKDVLTPEQVLSACDPKITRLEDIFAEALVEKAKAEAKAILEAADEQSLLEPMNAEEIHKTAKEEAKATRITKKRAVEILNDVLVSEGLLSAPEGKVEYLKVRVEKPAKHITQNGSNSDS